MVSSNSELGILENKYWEHLKDISSEKEIQAVVLWGRPADVYCDSNISLEVVIWWYRCSERCQLRKQKLVRPRRCPLRNQLRSLRGKADSRESEVQGQIYYQFAKGTFVEGQVSTWLHPRQFCREIELWLILRKSWNWQEAITV